MRTVTDNLREMAELIKAYLKELLITHSSISRWNDPNRESMFTVVNWAGDYSWNALSGEGLRIQSRVLEEYRRFSAIVHALLREQPQNSLTKLNEADSFINKVISRTKLLG